jgi:hypothetical protein
LEASNLHDQCGRAEERDNSAVDHNRNQGARVMAIANFKNIVTHGFDEDALSTTTFGEHILNFGNLTTSGDLANGISANADDVFLQNFGRIETSGQSAAGIFVIGNDAHLANYGTIVTHGDYDGFDDFASEGMFAEGDRFNIVNYGNIRIEGLFSSALEGFGDYGVLTNAGHIDSTGDGGAIFFAGGTGSQAINTGQVTANGEDIAAIIVSGAGVAALNRGSLELTGDGAWGMEAQGGENHHLTNPGIIKIIGDNSYGMLDLGGDAQIDNFGTIEMHGAHAIAMEAIGSHRLPAGEDISIVNGGHINTVGTLAIGIALGLPVVPPGTATNSSIANTGAIVTDGDGAAGALMFGNGNHLTNSGSIVTNGAASDEDGVGSLTAAGVLVSGDDAFVQNTRTGSIESKNASSAAIELNVVNQSGMAATNTSSILENFGLIKAPAVAILGGAGQETVINHGHIVGDVVLGDGADTFVFGKGGTLAGDLLVGSGDDLVRLEHGFGTGRVADFAAGDVIDVSAFFSSFSALSAHSAQHGNDVVINFDHNDQLTLTGVHLSALSASDFLFM